VTENTTMRRADIIIANSKKLETETTAVRKALQDAISKHANNLHVVRTGHQKLKNCVPKDQCWML